MCGDGISSTFSTPFCTFYLHFFSLAVFLCIFSTVHMHFSKANQWQITVYFTICFYHTDSMCYVPPRSSLLNQNTYVLCSIKTPMLNGICQHRTFANVHRRSGNRDILKDSGGGGLASQAGPSWTPRRPGARDPGWVLPALACSWLVAKKTGKKVQVHLYFGSLSAQI